MATEKQQTLQDKLNGDIRELLAKKGDDRSLYSINELLMLSQYTGDSKSQDEKSDGSWWDFYTPDEIVRICWLLAFKWGFKASNSSRVLEPSAGVGRFLRYAPLYCADVTAYEIDETSSKIAKLLYPQFNIINESFETHFYYKQGLNDYHYRTPKQYDLVIGNPPYMDYANITLLGKKEKEYYPSVRRMEQYFMVRGLDALESGGLLIYVIPSTIVDNDNAYKEFKDVLISKSYMLDLVRLPQKTFQDTDITTDIVVLQKK